MFPGYSGEISGPHICQVTGTPLSEKTYSTEATNVTLEEWDEGQPASDVLTPQCWHEGHIQVVMTTKLHGAHHQEPPAVWHPHWATRKHHHTTQLYGKIAYTVCHLINNSSTRPWGYCPWASLSLACHKYLCKCLTSKLKSVQSYKKKRKIILTFEAWQLIESKYTDYNLSHPPNTYAHNK